MIDIRETDLPGIGRKFQLNSRAGDKLVVVVHDDGRREMYHYYADDPEDSISMVALDDEESRCIASILGGMAYRPKALETVEVALGGMMLEWYKVEPGSFAIGKTIKELEVRKRTGATIIAIINGEDDKTFNPEPQSIIKEGATVVIIGEKEQVRACKKFLTRGTV